MYLDLCKFTGRDDILVLFLFIHHDVTKIDSRTYNLVNHEVGIIAGNALQWLCIPICVFFHKDSTTIVAQRGVRLFVEYSETFLSMSVKRKQK